MTAQSNEERLLSILRAHGQQFLNAFDIPAPKHKTDDSDDLDSAAFEGEWTGFGSSASRSTSNTASDEEPDSNFEQEDDDFVATSSRKPDVTVFLDSKRRQRETSPSGKELKRSFMSSRVSKVTSSFMQPASKGKKAPDEESEDERTNIQNDALLHRLVHTQLLSGSLNPELDLDHAQKGRALAGRVLELTGKAKLGKGESVFRLEQRNKAAKHIRDGLTRREREREQAATEEAKILGNYHPTLKRLYGPNPPAQKKRVRGLAMGVGKFVGGTLKLSQDEIASVTGPGKRLGDNHHHRMRRRSHIL